MKAATCAALIFLCFNSFAFARQDPTDPGIQDSVIMGSIQVDSSSQTQYLLIPIYIVTDDSVTSYNLPIRWNAPRGGVQIGDGTMYHWQLNYDGFVHYDSVLLNEEYIRMTGWVNFNDPGWSDSCVIFTNAQRLHLITLRVIIAPNAPRQLVTLDTTWDSQNFSIMFGLISGITEFRPAFQPGFIAIGLNTGTDDDMTPQALSLSQNYPNPFNSSTNINISVIRGDKVGLAIYDLLGRQIRSILNDRLGPGNYTIIWDGKDTRGSDVPSGTYFYRLTIGDKAETKKMILLR